MGIENKSQKEILDLIEKDRLQTTAFITQEILHRIKSPLSIIRGRAENLKSQLEYYQKDNAQGILDQIEQLEKLIGSVEEFVNLPSGTEKMLSVHDLIEDLNLFFQSRLSQGNIQVLNIIPKEFQIRSDECDIKTILMSVLVNAIEALESAKMDGKCIFVQYQKTAAFHILSVEDNGPGICVSQMRSLYQPFSTTKKGHIGLSLAICRKIAEKCGWKLEVVSRAHQGTRVEIWIPYSSGSSSP